MMRRKQRPNIHGITLEKAQMHLDEWLEAELEITTHQSYRLLDQTLTLADLDAVGRRIDYWRKMVAQLEALDRCNGRNVLYHVVPRDY